MMTCCVMATPERITAGLCLHFIAEKRAWRGSHFCSTECHRDYRKMRRNWRAQKACRLCGRAMRRKSDGPTVPSGAVEGQAEPVLSEHAAPNKATV